jgi:phosphate transport system substrate-binding protein
MIKTARSAAFSLVLLSFVPNLACADEMSITAAGSTALLPFVKAGAEAYQDRHPEVKISVTGGGSRVGITQVAAKAVDMGDSDILAEGYPTLIDHRVAVVGFAVVTNPHVGVTSLTKRQVRDIFSGKITNWNQVGGADQTIVVVNRPRSSGTRAVFTHVFMEAGAVNEAGLVEDATGTVVNAVSTTPGAISYAAFSGVRDRNVSQMKIDGVAPSDENVAKGTYRFWSYEHIFTNGAPAVQVARFLTFLQNDRQLAQELGYISMSAMKVVENDR